MLFSDTFLTIAKPVEGLFKDKGSRFISLAFPVDSEEEIKLIISDLRKQYHDARHHCYAYILGADKAAYRVNDDGEPAGSAGRPIFNVLISNDLTNILVVVVRYFGGTKLGIPGLINAYKEATRSAISQATIVERIVMETYFLEFGFNDLNEVMRIIKEHSLKLMDSQFDNTCQVKIQCRRGEADAVIGKLKKIRNLSISPY